MSNIFVGKTQFNDWGQALDRAASRSNGRIVVRDIADADTVIAYCKRHNLTAIAPTTYPQMKQVSANYGKFARAGIKVVACADYQLVETFDDKTLFAQFMLDQNLEDLIPEVFIASGRNGRSDYAPIDYPCILKLGVTFGGVGSTVHLDPQHPPALNRVEPGQSFLVQRFIPGAVEYGGHFYVESGDIKRAIYYSNRRDASILVQRGRMVTRGYDKADTIPEHGHFEDLFARLDYTGFACADFKVVDGVPKIFEVNPRLGGTLIHDEVDLPAFLLAPLDDA